MTVAKKKYLTIITLLTLHYPTTPRLEPYLEIARLENSLQHLRRTQDELRSQHSDDPDPELSQALRENEAVMSVPLFLFRSIIFFFL